MTDQEIALKLLDLRFEQCLDHPSGDYCVVGLMATKPSKPSNPSVYHLNTQVRVADSKVPYAELVLMTREQVLAQIARVPADHIKLVDIMNGKPIIELKETE